MKSTLLLMPQLNLANMTKTINKATMKTPNRQGILIMANNLQVHGAILIIIMETK